MKLQATTPFHRPKSLYSHRNAELLHLPHNFSPPRRSIAYEDLINPGNDTLLTVPPPPKTSLNLLLLAESDSYRVLFTTLRHFRIRAPWSTKRGFLPGHST
jgi:hypothetical protein